MTYDVLMRVSRYPVERNFNPPRHQRPAVAYDVAEHLNPLVGTLAPAGGECVGLQVTGPGGGGWQLQLSEGASRLPSWGCPIRRRSPCT